MSHFEGIFYSAQMLLRFFAALAVMLLAVATHNMLLTLLLIFSLVLLIRLLDGCWQNLVHLLKLLRWFMIPILLLHLFFSHGQLIFPATLFPFTWQGLQQGLWLSVHLSAVFLAAMLMFRALNGSEWNRLLLSLPFAGRELAIYLLMLGAMRSQISYGLQQLRMQWLLRRNWSDFPHLVLASFRFALSGSSVYAQTLWLRWPVSLDAQLLAAGDVMLADHKLVMNLGCLAVLLLACSLMFL